ncbi:hypothetical protein L1N85_08740 [Paenibacillus alkaliterrae]|uniref:hypothetical protein n=1 Tax=Paenibacillus alkaliterrae TaxID=320909 RepID=UPI001F37A7E6|nr:hypothetical protein [Paenibacillus alkaliterrae]MCF2938520.1 hypothetical protein [Paenibacillus alkaliterrae]
MIIGSGEHTYKIAEGWGKLPEGIQYGYTHGIVTDSQDRVYIFNTSKDSVIILSEDGEFISSWGEQFSEGAHGMLLHAEEGKEFLYLVDTASSEVVKAALDGNIVLKMEAPSLPEVYTADKKYVPTDVAVAPNGDIYVADGYGQSWIHHYDKNGAYKRSWGGLGEGAGQLNGPHGISVDTRGDKPLIYVADRSNHRIQVFTLEGEHVKFEYDELKFPCSFFQWGEKLYIPDLYSRITILDRNDKLIIHLGESDHYKTEGWPNLPLTSLKPTEFSSPHGICADSKGCIYVAEWISVGRITKLIPTSR